MIVHDVEQNSVEWLKLRCGIPTASEFGKIITPKTMKLSSQSTGYIYRLLGEWATGVPAWQPETEYMQLGHDLEDRAVQAYCLQQECEVQKVGFITSDDGMVGCSPDRIVTDWHGGVEIKTHPLAIAEHVRAMVELSIDAEHKPQTQGQMWVANLEYVDYVSYCGALPTVIVRSHRDEDFITALASGVNAFIEVMLRAREQLTQRYGPFTRPEPAKKQPDGDFDLTDEDVQRMIEESFPGSR